MSTLIDILQWRVSVHGSRPAFTFLVDGEPTDSLSFAQLDARARAIAASLQDRRCAGQPALLCHPPGLDYVAAFVGCLYAGALAIPLYPPRNRRHVGRIQAVVTNSGAPVVLTSTDHARDLAEWLGGEGQATSTAVVSTNDIETAAGERWRPIAPTPADLAYLQYTSGSTATPKGVMVSHENLLRNGDAIRDGFGYFPEGITVSWLPTFHDMGLLLTVVMPLLAGNPVYMMAPAAFVQRPFRWLDAIGRYRATHSGGPNFAFELCRRSHHRRAAGAAGFVDVGERVQRIGTRPLGHHAAVFAEVRARGILAARARAGVRTRGGNASRVVAASGWGHSFAGAAVGSADARSRGRGELRRDARHRRRVLRADRDRHARRDRESAHPSALRAG